MLQREIEKLKGKIDGEVETEEAYVAVPGEI
jgi:hypothetical protein